jgi:hypothetical protein
MSRTELDRRIELSNIQQKIEVLSVLYKEVLQLENEELSKKLSSFRVENLQWVLNALATSFNDLDFVLEQEESNYWD